MKIDCSSFNDKTCLTIAVKAMNDTVRKKGLVFSRVVFGIILRLPVIPTELPKQKNRMEIVAKTQTKINAITAERKIFPALRRKKPQYADHIF